MPNGWFYGLPEIDLKKLESLFRHKVLKLLLKERRISQEWVKKPLSFPPLVGQFLTSNRLVNRSPEIRAPWLFLSDRGI